MTSSEPTLVPEWLRSARSFTAGGSSTHFATSSSSHSDVSSSVHQARNRSSRSSSDFSSPRSTFLDRSYTFNSRRDSINGSAKHAYSSFTRQRDRDLVRDMDQLNSLDPWDHDASDPLWRISNSRYKEGFRRSLSMVSREQSEVFPGRDSKNDADNRSNRNSIFYNGSNRNGTISEPGNIVGIGDHKSVFAKNFVILGNNDRELINVSRVSSPCLAQVVSSSSCASSPLIVEETSALVGVRNVTGNMGSLSSPQSGGAALPGTGTRNSTSGLNMAEALTQAPLRAPTPPQVPLQAQRLEELAIKQSRQLIPVIPSTSKGSVLGSSDKSKTKNVARAGEMSLGTSRSGLQQPSMIPINTQSQPKHDSSKNAQAGKLVVLRPSRENGDTLYPKDVTSLANNANSKTQSSNHFTPVATPPTRTPHSPSVRKPLILNSMPGLTVERKSSSNRAQNRNDFFNLLKQKSTTNMSTDSSAAEKLGVSKEMDSLSESPHATVNCTEVANDGDANDGVHKLSYVEEKNLSLEAVGYPNEEERAFLRTLGWEESHDEDEGLTKEEIEAFITMLKKSKQTLNVSRGFFPKLSEIQNTYMDEASSGLSS